MTLRFSVLDEATKNATIIESLVWAGGGVCICCAKVFGQRSPSGTKNGDATVDHVFPLSARGADLERMRIRRALVVTRKGKPCHDRKAAAHARCNRKKGNRPPTGCEIVFLMAVNDTLAKEAARAPTLYASKADRRRAKRHRQKASKSKARAEMQEANR